MLEPGDAALRRGVIAKSLLLVLVLHVLALALLESGTSPAARAPRGPATVWVRTIEVPPAPTATDHVGHHDVSSLEGRVALNRARQVKPRPERIEADAQVRPSPLEPVQNPAVVNPDAGSAAHSATREVPLYATLIPPPVTLSFMLRRGNLQGRAEFIWRPTADDYEAHLESRIAGALLLVQSSYGGFDAAGLAPQRFTDRRARRGAQAVNFQRDLGKITFSTVPAEIGLERGVQDRLSWLIQLAAIVHAEPQRLVQGSRVTLEVVGTRGEAALWTFVSLGEERSGSESGAMPTVRLQRLPGAIYDTQVDVWLDLQPPHWPLRALMRNGPNDAGLELWRTDALQR